MSAPDFNALREFVSAAQPAGVGARRICPNCDVPCILSLGHASRKYFWRHVSVTDCAFTGIGDPIFFNTKEEALLNPKMFHKQ